MMQQLRMAHDKRRHTQAGCIAYTQRSFQGWRQGNRYAPSTLRSNVLQLVERKLANQEYRQHFGLKGILRLVPRSDTRPVTYPKLAVTIDGSRPHQVTHFI